MKKTSLKRSISTRSEQSSISDFTDDVSNFATTDNSTESPYEIVEDHCPDCANCECCGGSGIVKIKRMLPRGFSHPDDINVHRMPRNESSNSDDMQIEEECVVDELLSI